MPGYTATIRFDQGARDSVAHFLAHPEAQQADPAFDAWCDKVMVIAAHQAGMATFTK